MEPSCPTENTPFQVRSGHPEKKPMFRHRRDFSSPRKCSPWSPPPVSGEHCKQSYSQDRDERQRKCPWPGRESSRTSRAPGGGALQRCVPAVTAWASPLPQADAAAPVTPTQVQKLVGEEFAPDGQHSFYSQKAFWWAFCSQASWLPLHFWKRTQSSQNNRAIVFTRSRKWTPLWLSSFFEKWFISVLSGQESPSVYCLGGGEAELSCCVFAASAPFWAVRRLGAWEVVA